MQEGFGRPSKYTVRVHSAKQQSIIPNLSPTDVVVFTKQIRSLEVNYLAYSTKVIVSRSPTSLPGHIRVIYAREK